MCQPNHARPRVPSTHSEPPSPSEKAYRSRGAWLPGVTARCLRATSLALGLLAAAASQGQPVAPAARPQPAVAQAEGSIPPEQAMDAYAGVEGWVRAWEVSGAPRADPAGLAACRVALFESGRLVGSGSARGGGDALARSTGAALAEAEQKLLPARRDALWREQALAMAARLTVSVELAGPLTPLATAELDDPDGSLNPGVDGLAVRIGDQWSLEFPMQLLASEVTPSVEYPAMAARLLGDPTKGIELPRDLASEKGAVFYRFSVAQVAGVGPGGSALFLTRGGRVVELSEVTTPRLRAFAVGLLGHIDATRIGGDLALGIMGPVHPWRGMADPSVSTPTQQALAAVALLSLADTPHIAQADRDRAAALARLIMRDLQAVEEGEVRTEDEGVAGAVAWVALWRLGAGRDSTDELRPLFEVCEGMMREHAAAEPAAPRATVSEAVLAWAMARRAEATGLDREVAERGVRSIYAAAHPGTLAGLLPWLGWAELALAPEGAVPAGTALRQVRERVWEHQITEQDAGFADRDLSGGIAFTEGGVSLPTWVTIRPVGFLATMLGDPRLTSPQEVSVETVRLTSAMRFLEQLSAGEVECRFYPDPGLARGGIRAAVWDQRMPPEATSMALLATCEFLQSLDRVAASSQPSPP